MFLLTFHSSTENRQHAPLNCEIVSAWYPLCQIAAYLLEWSNNYYILFTHIEILGYKIFLFPQSLTCLYLLSQKIFWQLIIPPALKPPYQINEQHINSEWILEMTNILGENKFVFTL